MATIAHAPFVLRNVALTIGLDEYNLHTSQVEFTPTSAAVTWTGLGGNTYSSTGTATWTVTMALAQDWTTADSLSRYLMDHEGEEVEITFAPQAGEASFTSTVTIAPGGIGGTAGAVAVASVTLSCTKPVFVPAI